MKGLKFKTLTKTLLFEIELSSKLHLIDLCKGYNLGLKKFVILIISTSGPTVKGLKFKTLTKTLIFEIELSSKLHLVHLFKGYKLS